MHKYKSITYGIVGFVDSNKDDGDPFAEYLWRFNNHHKLGKLSSFIGFSLFESLVHGHQTLDVLLFKHAHQAYISRTQSACK